MAVNTVFTSDSSSLDKVHFKIQQQNIKLIEQNRLLAREAGKAHNQATGGAERVVGSLVRMAAGYLTVQTAIQAVTSAMKDQEEQQRKSRDATLSLAEAKENMLQNLGKATQAEKDQFDQQIKEVVKRTPAKGGLRSAYSIAGMGLSASSGNKEQTLAAMEQARLFAPNNEETQQEIAGAILDSQKATGRASALENLGLVQWIGQNARMTDWAKIARSVGQAVQTGVNYGSTPQETGAMLAAFSQISGDVTGKKSTMATGKFIEQLAEFYPKEDIYGQKFNALSGGMQRVVVRKGTGLTHTSERLERLWSNRSEREEFLQGLQLESAQKAAGRQFATGPETPASRLMAETLKKAGTYETMAREAKSQRAVSSSDFVMKLAAGVHASETSGEMAMTDTPGGRERAINASFTSEELEKMLAAAGVSYWPRKAAKWNYWGNRISQDEEGAFSDIVGGQASWYQAEAGRARRGGDESAARGLEETGASLGNALRGKKEAAAGQREEAARLDLLERTATAVEGINKKLDKPTPAAIQMNARTSR